MTTNLTHIHLRGIDVRFDGRDSTTPDGHWIANGVDTLGNHRVWLFEGDAMSDAGYRGSILIPREYGAPLIAYGAGGGYVRSGRDFAELFAVLIRDYEARRAQDSDPA
ncbi:hypothetical protein [Nocardia farcinica]|uniref:hypothetical protein n=1 Tax=Nocardia farcinica TaxID=37329 RepID=UPI002458B62B|nr:hypothetical protein [Nocardia farcinica]